MVSHRYKFVFIHIPKTAGHSILSALAQYGDDKYNFTSVAAGHIIQNRKDEMVAVRSIYGLEPHATLQEHANVMGIDKIKNYFKFCCVRNPFERLVSACAFSAKMASCNIMKNTLCHRQPQWDYMTINNKFSMDDFIRVENIQEDFNRICNKIGIVPSKLIRKNQSKHSHYSDYYDEELKQMVIHKFKTEIDYFNYTF